MNHLFQHIQGHLYGAFRPRLLPTGGAAVFSLDLVDLYGARLLWWYGARDSATLGQTSAGVSAVASGDPIGYIADKSDTGLHLTQPTSAKRIKLGVDGDGLPYFYFDGTKTISLDSASVDLSAHDDITVFMAAFVDATDGALKFPFYFNPAGAGFAAYASGAALTVRCHNGTDQHNNDMAGVVTTSPQIYEFRFSPSSRRQLDAANAGVQGQEWEIVRSSNTDAAGVSGGTFATGPLRFGDWGAADYSWEGGIYEMFAISGEITQAERLLIQRHLGGSSGAPVPVPYARLDFSHANTYRAIDSTAGFNAYSLSALYYDTSATSVDITYYCRGVVAGQVSLGVYVDGVYHTEVTPAGAGVQSATVALPAGSKRVGLLNSIMSGNGTGVASVQSVITDVEFNATATPYLYPSTNRIMVYGDSVATGGHASPNQQYGWPLLVRYGYDVDVAVYAESGRAFKTDYDISGFASGVRDPFVEQVKGYAPSILWFAMGVNDYGQANWTAAAFGTAYAATLDALHTALPSLHIYAQSPLNPAYGAANNGLGDNLQDYCDAIEAACVGREAWVTYVDGSFMITDPGTELTDGVHPNNAGNATYAENVAGILGLSAFEPRFLFPGGEQGAVYDPSDFSTLFQDSAGTTPVTAVEQPVGLILDKRLGLALGSELVPASYVGTQSGAWLVGTTSVTRNGSSTGQAAVTLTDSVVVGKTYRISFTVTGLSGDTFFVRLTSGGTALQVSSNGSYIANFTALAAGIPLQFAPWAGSAGQATISNISVKELAGNHALQATAAARPVVSARKNFPTYTEDLTNAIWSKVSCTVTSGVSDPLGGTSAFTVTALGANGRIPRSDSEVAMTSSATYTLSAYMRRRTGTGNIQFFCGHAPGFFSPNLAITAEWQRLSWTFTATSTGSDIRLVQIITSGDAIDIWHPQLETGSTATTYQRVTTSTNYDTVGFPHYVKNDGVDDLLATTFPNLGGACTIARAVPFVGASILTGQTIGAGVRNDSTNHAGLVIIDRALTVGETAALTAYLNAKAGV